MDTVGRLFRVIFNTIKNSYNIFKNNFLFQYNFNFKKFHSQKIHQLLIKVSFRSKCIITHQFIIRKKTLICLEVILRSLSMVHKERTQQLLTQKIQMISVYIKLPYDFRDSTETTEYISKFSNSCTCRKLQLRFRSTVCE